MARKASLAAAIAVAIGTLLLNTPAASAAPTVGEVAVAQIIDGDTFVTADGVKIRPLGIDSCEMGTPGGQRAKEDAAIWLNGQNVVLTTEPGVDLDVHGRSLRYVEVLGGIDYGKLMVSYDHTSVYKGKLAPKYSANPTYLAELRAQDSDGRNCAGTASTAPPVIINKDGDDDHHRGKGWVRRHVCKRWC